MSVIKNSSRELQTVYYHFAFKIAVDNACDRLDCSPNAVCKIFEPTGEAFCEPSCSLNNGGCQDGETCSVVGEECERCPIVGECVRVPCPVVECTDPCSECSDNQICKLEKALCFDVPCPAIARCVDKESVCSLPSNPGPCRAAFPMYFHNSETGICEQFIYGGCAGNDNNFGTQESCEEACAGERNQW